MRTVQRTYTLFGIAELEGEARQKAYTDWLAKGNDYPYASDNCDTLEAFCNLFRIACTNYCYDSCTYAYRFHTGHEEETERLSSVRLLAYLYNNFHAELYKPKVYWTKDRKKRRRSRISVTCECPFTGVVSDEIILQQPCRKEPQRQGVFGLYRFRSHSRHGLYLREDRVLFGRKPNRNGGNHAITFPPLCFIAASPGRVAIRPDFFFYPPVGKD